MRIRPILLSAAGFTIALGATALLVGAMMVQRVMRLDDLQARAEEGAHHAQSLLALSEDYMLHPTARSVRQWYRQHELLQQTLQDSADLTPQQAEVLHELRNSSAQLREGFDRLQRVGDADSDPLAADQRTMLADSLVVETQRISDGAYQLSRELDDVRRQGDELRRRFVRAMAVLAASTIIGLIVFVELRVLRPLRNLQRVTHAVREGDFDARSDESASDEFGDLARDFNAMTATLQERSEELKENERTVRVLTERLPALVAFVDREQRYRFCSLQYERTFDRPVSEIVGRHVSDLFGPGEFDVVRPQVEKALQGQGVRFIAQRTVDGISSHFLTEYTPELDARGQVVGYYVMALDISDQVAAEKARDELKSQLREAQKMESIGTLAGGIAHDFNNVLAAILGNVELVTTELPPDSPAQKGLSQIRRASLRARDLVQQILAFSRRVPASQTVQSVTPVLREAHELLRATIPAGIDLVLRLDARPMHARIDPVQLQQVIMNLGVNAWQAMPDPHGRIVLSAVPCRIDEPGVDGPISLPAGAYVHLSMSDNGQGMPETVRQRIFEPFFTTKEVGRGTGLGLSVVHGIVQSHQGAITVDSSVGVGSVFHVWLPLAEEASQSQPAANVGNAVPPGRGQRVMFVDDDELMRLMTERLLERLGYRPVCFEAAATAIDVLRADPGAFDLVLTDYNMPDMTGIELAQAVSGLPGAPPVVMSSGYIDDALRLESQRSGVASLIQKEHLMDHLAAELHAVFSAQSGDSSPVAAGG